jgi:hypothetical protein
MSINDQRFDWPPVLSAPFIEDLTSIMFPAPEDKRKGVDVYKAYKDRVTIAEHLISSLYQAYSSPHTPNTVSYPLKNDAYKLNSQFLIPYSRTRAKEVLERLTNLSWIKVTDAVEQKKYTRIKAAGGLADMFDEVGLIWFPQKPLEPYRTVLMRDVVRDAKGIPLRRGAGNKTKKHWVEVEQSKEVKRIQDNLHIINSFLTKQCITLDLTDEQLNHVTQELNKNKDDNKQLLDLRRVQLVRIFSRGTLDKGGRFYRGWWLGVPSKHRPHIRINGSKTVEVDYSAMHIRILYAQAGIEYSLNKDPYDLGLSDWLGKQDPRRKLIKQAFNALINDEDNVYTIDKTIQQRLNLTHTEFLDKIKSIHPKLYPLLQSDVGLKTQRLDSDIAEEVMLSFINEGITCLPIHDSFIVPAGYAWDLQQKLKEAFKKFVGVTTEVDVGGVKSSKLFNLSFKEIESIPIEESIYTGKRVYEELVNKRSSGSSMDNYLKSYKNLGS